jgi:hypothetical protein
MAGNILGKLHIDNVEGHDQIFIIINLCKGIDNTGLRADVPYPFLVGHAIGQNHPLFINDGQVRSLDRRRIVALVTKVALASG